MTDFLKDFCEKVVAVDRSIRFAGLAEGDGKLVGFAERKGLKPLLTPEERAQYAITAANRQHTRLRWEYLLGKINFATSHYEKVIRGTVPISDNKGELYYVLLLSFDVEVGAVENIITKKIIPLVRKSSAKFAKAGKKSSAWAKV
jgi:hypothetical protein